MASSQNVENGTQIKTCRCGEGDPNAWTNRASDNSDNESPDCPNCQIMKSGHLFVSSKGLAWPSWKRRWFVLTRTSLIFFRHDPNSPPIRGSEPNATLGGIDLNSSGSVVVKADKKLLTVLFPDGRDGRTFTLKADTLEDLNDWKNALENALAQAPSMAHNLGQNGIFRNDPSANPQVELPPEQKEKPPEKSLVQTPVIFALEDQEGNPSFLEKALCFIEDYGIKVEGIFRQSADVEEVKRRVEDYEQGKDEFSPDEDAHVIGDCIKLVLREMPEYPVPAECCTALVDAYRVKISDRMDAIRDTIYETFPEPNRLLLQRILRMMLEVAEHKVENRMSLQALAACMAPLLLRPLVGGPLVGGGRVEGDFNNSANGPGDSFQLLQAAAAANSAQNIVIILLEEYDQIFDDDAYSSEVYTESEEEGDEYHEESTGTEIRDKQGDSLDDDGYDEDEDDDDDVDAEHDDDDDSYDHDDHHEHEVHVDNRTTHLYEGTETESNSEAESNMSHDKDMKNNNSQAIQYPKADTIEHKVENVLNPPPSSSTSTSALPEGPIANRDISQGWSRKHAGPVEEPNESQIQQSTASSASHVSLSRAIKLSDRPSEVAPSGTRNTMWGRTSARKNLSMESVETNSDDEDRVMVQKLESTKMQLQTKLSKEKKENAALLASLERRRDALQEQRLQLEKDVEKLREQLKQEKKLRTLLEAGLSQHGQSSSSSTEFDKKILADIEAVAVEEEEISNLKHKVLDLRGEYNRKLEKNYASLRDFCNNKLNNSTDIKNCTTLEDERDKIFADFIDKHGPPAPCPPEIQRTESTNQNNNTCANDEQVNSGPASKSKKVSPENEKRHLPPKSTKSGWTSTSSTFGEELGMPPEKQEFAQNPPSLRSFSQGDNLKRENPFALNSVPKSLSQKQPEGTSVDALAGPTSLKKTSSSSSSTEAGSLSPAAKAKLTKRLQFLKERLAQRASENGVIQPANSP